MNELMNGIVSKTFPYRMTDKYIRVKTFTCDTNMNLCEVKVFAFFSTQIKCFVARLFKMTILSVTHGVTINYFCEFTQVYIKKGRQILNKS